MQPHDPDKKSDSRDESRDQKRDQIRNEVRDDAKEVKQHAGELEESVKALVSHLLRYGIDSIRPHHDDDRKHDRKLDDDDRDSDESDRKSSEKKASSKNDDKDEKKNDDKDDDTKDEKKTDTKKPSRKSVHIMRIAAGVFALIVIAVVAILSLSKVHGTDKKQADNQKETAKGPLLEVAKVKKAPPVHEMILEAEARPVYQATIFAKVSGYLRDIRVIEGTHVKTGDILAVIDSPETDQAYEAARADAYNKNKIAGRNRSLLRQRLISPQEAEQAFADARVATANLRSAKEQKDYEILRAPFDGIVTARLVDPGALIPNASNSKTAQLAVVNLADTSRLKIDAFIEQRYAPDIFANMPVEMYLPDRNAERFPGKVARVSGVLDPRTRMLFLEMDFDNSAGKIVSGSFVSVSIKIRRPPLLQAPIQALVTKNNAPALATVDQNNKIKLVPIQIYENDGTNVMISSGTKEGQRIALDVGAELKDGDSIQAIDSDKEQQGGSGPQQKQASDHSMTGGSEQGSISQEAAQSGGSGSSVGDTGNRQPEAGTVSATSQSAQTPGADQQAPPQGEQQNQGQPQGQPQGQGQPAGGKGQGGGDKNSAKQQSGSGESQPKPQPAKPSLSNSTFLPNTGREPNE